MEAGRGKKVVRINTMFSTVLTSLSIIHNLQGVLIEHTRTWLEECRVCAALDTSSRCFPSKILLLGDVNLLA